jgi:hypothetical protein
MNQSDIYPWSNWREEGYELLVKLLYNMMEENFLFFLPGNTQAKMQEYIRLTAELAHCRHLFFTDTDKYASLLSQKMEEAHQVVIRDLNLLEDKKSYLNASWRQITKLRTASIIARNNF